MRALGVFFASWLLALPALADEPASADARAEARRAYEAGVSASESGDLGSAARAFARADELAPNATALESALEAALRADDPALGMQLVERGELRPDASALPVVARARDAFSTRAGRVHVRCNEPCNVSVDGLASPTTTLWLAVGAHRFRAASSGSAREPGADPERTVEVKAGVVNEVDLSVAPPAVAPAPTSVVPAVVVPGEAADEPERGVLSSPAVFFVGVGAVAVLGGVAVWSFGDLDSIHSEFEKGSATYDGSPGARRDLESLAADGKGAATRSWALFGAAAATAVGTGLVGLFVTDWEGTSTPPIEASVGPLGGAIKARF